MSDTDHAMSDDERCGNCTHFRVFSAVPGGLVEGGFCARDGEDARAYDWCEAWRQAATGRRQGST
jgi:hypothetical protein